jgi:hypothetical protein
MQKLEPQAYGIPENLGVSSDEIRVCWRLAIKEL